MNDLQAAIPPFETTLSKGFDMSHRHRWHFNGSGHIIVVKRDEPVLLRSCGS